MKILSVSAISNEVIEAAFSYSHSTHLPLILSVDRAQVNYDSGYISTTPEFFRKIYKLRNEFVDSNILIARKNCGPETSFDSKEVWKTIEVDSKNNFDIMHFDFSKLRLSRSDTHSRTLRAIKYSRQFNPDIKIEIGHSNLRLPELQHEIDFYLSNNISPTFCSIYTGTDIKDGVQYGTFELDSTSFMSEKLKTNSIFVKEYESDFLTESEISVRKAFVDCLEVGTELAICQNNVIVNECLIFDVSLEKILKEATKNKSWKKLLRIENPDNDSLCLSLTLHWYLSSPEGQRIHNKVVGPKLKSRIIDDISNIIHRYVVNFYEL